MKGWTWQVKEYVPRSQLVDPVHVVHMRPVGEAAAEARILTVALAFVVAVQRRRSAVLHRLGEPVRGLPKMMSERRWQ